MLPSIEQHMNWIADGLEARHTRGAAVVELEAEAQEACNVHVGSVTNITPALDLKFSVRSAPSSRANRGRSCHMSVGCRPTSNEARLSRRGYEDSFFFALRRWAEVFGSGVAMVRDTAIAWLQTLGVLPEVYKARALAFALSPKALARKPPVRAGRQPGDSVDSGVLGAPARLRLD